MLPNCFNLLNRPDHSIAHCYFLFFSWRAPAEIHLSAMCDSRKAALLLCAAALALPLQTQASNMRAARAPQATVSPEPRVRAATSPSATVGPHCAPGPYDYFRLVQASAAQPGSGCHPTLTFECSSGPRRIALQTLSASSATLRCTVSIRPGAQVGRWAAHCVPPPAAKHTTAHAGREPMTPDTTTMICLCRLVATGRIRKLPVLLPAPALQPV